MAVAKKKTSSSADKRVSLTTGTGVLCFPHVFKDNRKENDKGELQYEVQILIPKKDRAAVKAIVDAIREVAQAKWGDNWKSVRLPLRDGDKEAKKIAEDGQTYGEKYPERAGHYFLNARSKKPIGVFDRSRTPIVDEDEIYGGCRAKIAVTFYPYSSNGNTGVGVGLNGVQKIGDGEPFGGGAPAVETMFDLMDEEDDDLDTEFEDEVEEEEEVEEAPAPKRRAPAKKTAAKKAAPKRKAPEPEVEDLEDEDLDDGDEDADDMYDDID